MRPQLSRFTAAEVVRLTGIPYGTLNYWARIGLVKPSVSPASGSGSRRIYDAKDLAAIRVALRLRRGGIFGKALARILAVLREAGFDSPASVQITVTSEGDVAVKSPGGESFSAHRSPGQLFLNLSCDFTGAQAEIANFLRDDQARRKGVRRAVPKKSGERKTA